MEEQVLTRFTQLKQVDAERNGIEFERDIEALINLIFILLTNDWT